MKLIDKQVELLNNEANTIRNNIYELNCSKNKGTVETFCTDNHNIGLEILFLEKRLGQINRILNLSEVVEVVDNGLIQIGSTVKVCFTFDGDDIETNYVTVIENKVSEEVMHGDGEESHFFISSNSEVGKALLNKSRDDIFKVKVGNFTNVIQVLDVINTKSCDKVMQMKDNR